MNDPTQEVWITVRVKGYAPIDADLNALALGVAKRCLAAEWNIGVFPAFECDVLDVEEEAAIYDNE